MDYYVRLDGKITIFQDFEELLNQFELLVLHGLDNGRGHTSAYRARNRSGKNKPLYTFGLKMNVADGSSWYVQVGELRHEQLYLLQTKFNSTILAFNSAVRCVRETEMQPPQA